MTTNKKIIPCRERCECGKKVLNHHWLCDGCYGKKHKLLHKKNKKKKAKILKRMTEIIPLEEIRKGL
jgi:hypothetical protein